jgi:hypothetical protein
VVPRARVSQPQDRPANEAVDDSPAKSQSRHPEHETVGGGDSLDPNRTVNRFDPAQKEDIARGKPRRGGLLPLESGGLIILLRSRCMDATRWKDVEMACAAAPRRAGAVC